MLLAILLLYYMYHWWWVVVGSVGWWVVVVVGGPWRPLEATEAIPAHRFWPGLPNLFLQRRQDT